MTCSKKFAALSALAVACAPVVASADVLFTDNFDAGTSASRYDTFNHDLAAGAHPPYDTASDFNFDYGAYTYFYTDTGGNVNASALIPQAPRSTVGSPKIGLRLDANNTADPATPNGSVINLYPKLAQYTSVPSGDHKLTFDVWMNYTGPYEGNLGSMEFFSAGINTSATGITGVFPGPTNPNPPTPSQNIPGLSIAANGERTNTIDFRFYRNNLRLGSLDASTGYIAQDEGTGAPGPADGRNQFYQQAFPFENPDPSIDEAWYETPGSMGKHWNTVEVKMEDEIFYWYVKPAGAAQAILIGARTERALTSGGIMLGYADIVSGTAALDNRNPVVAQRDANFGIFDNIVVETVTQVRPTWANPAGGTWSTPGNWTNGVPNGTSAVADFAGAIASPQTVTVDGAKTVRSIVFNNANSYTIAGTDTITIDGFTSGIRGTLKALNGSHTISAPLLLNKPTDAIVNTGATINVTQDVATAAGVGVVKMGGGTLQLKNARFDSLAINAGTVAITTDGGAAGTSVLKSLTIAASNAKLNLNDNDLLIDYTGAVGTLEADIRQHVKNGRLPASTSGIVSTPGPTIDDRVLAVADNAALNKTSWNGIPVDSSTIIGKYTFFGDANLDGAVTGDDYLAVDAGLGIGTKWIQGDFNLDGAVTGDDYLAVDANLGKGSPTPLAFGDLKEQMVALHVEMFGEGYLAKLADVEANGFGTLVPEPGALSLIGLGAAGLLGRRRRRA